MVYLLPNHLTSTLLLPMGGATTMTHAPGDLAGEDPNIALLRNLDYTHSWTFDVEHIVELYQVCRVHPGRTALEIGSFRGHCALAMALAGLRVTSIDSSDKHLASRSALIEQHGARVDFLIESSDRYIDRNETFDVILHDNSRRGGALISELDAYWRRTLDPGGLLIVHNVEQVDLPRLVRRLEPENHIVTTDKRRRQLGYFAKPHDPIATQTSRDARTMEGYVLASLEISTMRSIEIDGLQIAFEQRGEGPPLLFLHSIFTDSRIWAHQLDEFAGSHTVIAWDAPGCGSSADPPAAWSMSQYAELLNVFLDRLGIGSAHIAGAAWGSTLGLELYRLHPGIVRSLVLTSAYAGWKGSLSADEIKRRLDRFHREMPQPPESFIGSWIPTFVTPGASKESIDAIVEMMRDLHPDGARWMAEALAESDHRAFLPSVDVPVLIINGEADRRAPVAVARAIREAIPASRLQLIPGAGHIPYLERPEQFNAALRAFLSDQV